MGETLKCFMGFDFVLLSLLWTYKQALQQNTALVQKCYCLRFLQTNIPPPLSPVTCVRRFQTVVRIQVEALSAARSPPEEIDL